MAGKKGPGPTEPGFLDLPTFTLAALLAFFLILSTLFERATHWLIHSLKRRKRNGLAQAVSNLVMELTLVGFVSLLLVVLQGPISKICVPYSPGPYSTWNLISNVPGCDCCLSQTASVSSCFLASRECGTDFCNCDGRNATCLADETDLGGLFQEWQADPACAADVCGQAYLNRAAASKQAEAAISVLTPQCDALIGVDNGKCGAGKAPLVTITALHELHIFIFVVAMSHVVMGVIMVLLASWQLHMWRTACADEDDEHAQAVRKALAARRRAAPKRLRRLLSKVAGSRVFSSFSGRRPGNPSQSSQNLLYHLPASPAHHVSLSIEVVQRGAASGAALAAGDAADSSGSRHSKALKAGSSSGDSLAVPTETSPETAAASAALPAGQTAAAERGEAGREMEEGQAPPPPPSFNVKHNPVGPNNLDPSASLELDGRMLPEVAPLPPLQLPAQQAAASDAGQQGIPPSPGGSLGSRRSAFLSRSASIARNDYGGWVVEYTTCLLLQFNPRPVSASDIRLMRAAFMLTHRVPAGFDFWRYVSDSMEDDFAHIVGISLEMWLTLIVFVLISGPLGWATTLFLALAGMVLVVVNAKLISIIRHVCRGARVNQLSSNIFWWHKPDLLLHPIKYVLFLCAFIGGSALFFLWSFGPSSCPFSGSFYFALVLPWYTLVIFALLLFLDASMRTLPCYSLAVQMGSEFKHHMLPRGIREKLLLAAARIKRKHREQKKAAQQQPPPLERSL